MGNFVGFAWAAIVYPPLRAWELKRFGRWSRRFLNTLWTSLPSGQHAWTSYAPDGPPESLLRKSNMSISRHSFVPFPICDAIDGQSRSQILATSSGFKHVQIVSLALRLCLKYNRSNHRAIAVIHFSSHVHNLSLLILSSHVHRLIMLSSCRGQNSHMWCFSVWVSAWCMVYTRMRRIICY